MPLNDSSTGGFVAPYSPPVPPLDDDALDQLLQQLVAGVTGLPGTLVRPRWQGTPPIMPEPATDWCAIGVIDATPECGAVLLHWRGEPTNIADIAGQGFDEYQSMVTLRIMASFYGPNAAANADLFRDGLSVGQNRETLFANNSQLVSTDCVMGKVPELINLLWYHRVDITFKVVRMIDRSYPILNILEADGTIKTDAHTLGPGESFQAGPNPPVRPDYGGPQP
jgi:hypothetical protein